jgi:hypothetical protein
MKIAMKHFSFVWRLPPKLCSNAHGAPQIAATDE